MCVQYSDGTPLGDFSEITACRHLSTGCKRRVIRESPYHTLAHSAPGMIRISISLGTELTTWSQPWPVKSSQLEFCHVQKHEACPPPCCVQGTVMHAAQGEAGQTVGVDVVAAHQPSQLKADTIPGWVCNPPKTAPSAMTVQTGA